jgi:hypothetical protein
VLLQVAVPAHIAVPFSHSLTSVHTVPLPVYPLRHVQVKDPSVLVQTALLLQSAVPKLHSSMSLQLVPSPL